MLSIIKLKAIIMQPCRISFISIRQYLIYNRRLFILIVDWQTITQTAVYTESYLKSHKMKVYRLLIISSV